MWFSCNPKTNWRVGSHMVIFIILMEKVTLMYIYFVHTNLRRIYTIYTNMYNIYNIYKCTYKFETFLILTSFLKVRLSPSKIYIYIYIYIYICFNISSSKMMKNAFYFISKALFVLKIFKLLPPLFGHVEKTAWSGK